MDKITVTILPDGSFKIETDRVSAANHVNAEATIRELCTLAGGEKRRTLKPGADLSHALHHHAADGHTH